MIITSPLANKVFNLSKNPVSSMLDSSMMKHIFSFLQPALLNTALMSSSKSAAEYLE